MRRGARLHRHYARQHGEERDELVARELARCHDLALRVDRVNLKDFLARSRPTRATVDKFRIDLPMDGFLQMGFRQRPPSWHANAVRGAVYPIIPRLGRQSDRSRRSSLLPSALPRQPPGHLLIDVASAQQIEMPRLTGHPLPVGGKFERPRAVLVAAEGAGDGHEAVADQPILRLRARRR